MSKAKAKAAGRDRGGLEGGGAGGGSGQATEEGDARELKLGEGFVKAKCMTNAEAAVILKRKELQFKKLSNSGYNDLPPMLEKSVQYLQRFGRNGNSEILRQLTDGSKLAEFEVCMLGNLMPESVEDAKSLVPSITKKGQISDEKLQQVVDALNKTCEGAESTKASDAEHSTKAFEGEDSTKVFEEANLTRMSE